MSNKELSYQHLAPIYDRLQQGIDLTVWADYIQGLEASFSLRRGPGDGHDGRPLLLDLGCGTGSFCLEMARRGYDLIGIDASAPMLGQARHKACQAAEKTLDRLLPVLFLQQDISRFELFGTVDLAVSLLDTVNHLIRPDQVQRLFRLCANYLNPGGLFIFDVASRRHLARTLGNQLFYQDNDDFTLFWQNSYRAKSGISRSELTLFTRQADNSYQRFDETIAEKFYEPTQIRQWLQAAGLETAACYAELKHKPPGPSDERHFFIARKPLDQF